MSGIALPARPSARVLKRCWLAVGTGWWAIAFAIAAVIVFAATGTRLSLGSAGRVLLLVPVLIAATVFYRYYRPAPALADCLETTLKLLAILLLGMLISLPAATLGAHFPFRDALLARTDIAIGFNHAIYVGFVTHHPFLRAVLHAAYLSMIGQFFLIGLLLALTGQRARREAFIGMTALTLAVTLTIFVFMPAVPPPGGAWAGPLEYMRANVAHALSFDSLNGIVTFPSFHTEAACLFIWASWRTPYVRWPVLALNLALVASTPVDGLHYGIDVLAGMTLSLIAIYLLAPNSSAKESPALAPVQSPERQIA
jgi:hypothetical protein